MNFDGVLEKPIQGISAALLSLWYTQLFSLAVEMTWTTLIFFSQLLYSQLTQLIPLLDLLMPAICCKSTVRQVCSTSSCQAFGINSLFSIPPTPCQAGLCEISSRKQWLFRLLLLLLLNLFGCLERDWTKTAQARGLPVLSRQLF